MIFRLFRRSPPDDSIASLYGAIVAQARAAAFYRDYGVPDTVDGRLEMVVLHLVLLLHRLNTEPGAPRATGQALFDAFCSDMDANLREMGVGDLAIPRRMRSIGEVFYGRQRAYEAALNGPDGELDTALARNVFGLPGPDSATKRLVAYVRAAVAALGRQEGGALVRAQLAFPDPAEIMVSQTAAEGAP
jgi:cytochrome b pre-mRNA-processing protein 3